MNTKNTQENKNNVKKLAKFLFGLHRNANLIIRFNTRQRSYNETVAAHTHFVSLYSMVLADILIEEGHEVDVEKVLRKAIVHDIEENSSGDVIRTFKRDMEDAYEKLSLIAVKKTFEELPDNLQQYYTNAWKENDDSIETKIVKIADELSGVIYCAEQRKMGNRFFDNILTSYIANVAAETENTIFEHLASYIREILINYNDVNHD